MTQVTTPRRSPWSHALEALHVAFEMSQPGSEDACLLVDRFTVDSYRVLAALDPDDAAANYRHMVEAYRKEIRLHFPRVPLTPLVEEEVACEEEEYDDRAEEQSVVESMTWEQADVYYNALVRELHLAVQARNQHAAQGTLIRLQRDFPNDCMGSNILYTAVFGHVLNVLP